MARDALWKSFEGRDVVFLSMSHHVLEHTRGFFASIAVIYEEEEDEET